MTADPPALQPSWVDSANREDCDFSLNNLPCGVISREGETPRCAVAIGDFALDLAAAESGGLLAFGGCFASGDWRGFMARGPTDWAALRRRLTTLLRHGSRHRAAVEPHLRPLGDLRLHLPFTVTEFTDFYASRHHAENVGRMFRGAAEALPPNWLHMPIGYNGRASSVVVSGGDLRRPHGQVRDEGAAAPRFAASERLDFELELGAVVGLPSSGPLGIAAAQRAIFGFVLLNDWSARDLQTWEYRPLGPFLSKATATTISPWIVTRAALEPFRVAAPPREVPLLDYLADRGPMHYDIALTAALAPAGGRETRLTATNARELYYSAAQQLVHHASSGCPMRTGDLLGSGTVSGPGPEACGSLLELSRNGTRPVPLDGGGTRAFLDDGDRVTLRGAARGADFRIGFGDCTGRVLPAGDFSPAGG